MYSQHDQGYQRPPSDAERQELQTMNDSSVGLQVSHAVDSETVSQVSDLSDSQIIRSENEQLGEHHVSTATPTTASLPSSTPTWLPYTLRRTPLSLILGFLLLLELAVVVLHVVSSKNLGLAENDGSTAVAISSKFVPTLLAVALSLLATILLDDVKRTEPFARMTAPDGASVKESLTWTTSAWWPFPSPLGKGKLPLFSATLLFMLASLIVSPLSSTLLVAQDVVFDEKTPFKQLDLASLVPIQPIPSATTYFRTISNILQNVSTTAWITNDYVVMPFWPGNLSTIPLSPILSDEVQRWSAYTTIFSAELECEPLVPQWNHPMTSSTMDTKNISITLSSKSGCTIDLKLSNDSIFSTAGGETWSSVNNISSSSFADKLNGFISDDARVYEGSNFQVHGCSENETLISSTEGSYDSFNSDLTNFIVNGQVCQNMYYVGNSTANVILGQGQSVVEVNTSEYHMTKKPIAATIANTAAFDNVFFDTNWTIHINPRWLSSNFDESVGPAVLLSAMHQFSSSQVVTDASIGQDMQRIRKQFFAELLHGTFELMTVADAVEIPGSVITTSRRIVVVSGVAIALEIVLLVLSALVATVLYTTRPSTRFLGLSDDPSPVLSITRLLSSHHPTTTAFTYASNGSTGDLGQSLSRFRFILAGGQIETTKEINITPNTDSNGSCGVQEQSKSPALRNVESITDAKKRKLFSPWLLGLLLFFLLSTLATIAALLQYSQSQGLYNTAFVYNIDISISGRKLGAINPASLLTTFIGVVISIWWGSFDNTLRKVQPCLAMAKAPASGNKGIAVSYKSSYLLWAAYRAGRRKHWILLLVSTGTFLAQILTIALSSLWTRAPGALTNSMFMPQTLQLRNIPMVEVGTLPQSPHNGAANAGLIKNIFSNLGTSWIYGATTQLTLQGPDPPWGVDGWSFVPRPLNITSQSVQNTGNGSELSLESVNVTVNTPAIRARLECSPSDIVNDEALWLTRWDLTNKTYWNTSANPRGLEVGYELGVWEGADFGKTNEFPLRQSPEGANLTTTFFVNNRRLQCCENRTIPSAGMASIGYWSPNTEPGKTYPDFAKTWPANFTIKWIRGRPIEGILRAGQWPGETAKHLLFVEPPQMTALNCQPIIESANSQVTVDSNTGRVISYSILEMPQPYDDAWSSAWVAYQHNFTWDDPRRIYVNITVSHGVLFTTGLLGSADIYNFGGKAVDMNPADTVENTQEQTFNLRQPGLNVDYMTYSMLSLVDFDHQQLLDATTLERTANRTFSIMYQHFVNNNLSLTEGGFAYQAIDEKPAADIGDRYHGILRRDTQDTNASTTGDQGVDFVQIARPVELLHISTPAAWQYNRMLPGPIDTIADTIVLIAGSTKLLELAKLRSTASIKGDSKVLTKLDWFDDAEGQKRWGIELADGPDESDTLIAHHDSVDARQSSQEEWDYGRAYTTGETENAADDPAQSPFTSSIPHADRVHSNEPTSDERWIAERASSAS
ncbi:hypothetical protein F4808DRAFT_473290 [Astrocystis sublimbata]|nr:hypothetical protein F4808DRAFT_473290 [Astrocystis sublimbata]